MSFSPVWFCIQVLRLWSHRVMPSMTPLPVLLRCATDIGHLAGCCPSQCNASLDLRKEIPNSCHHLDTSSYRFIFIFTGPPTWSLTRPFSAVWYHSTCFYYYLQSPDGQLLWFDKTLTNSVFSIPCNDLIRPLSAPHPWLDHISQIGVQSLWSNHTLSS